MQTTCHPFRRLTSVVLALSFFLLAPLFADAAEKPKKAPAVKQTAKKTTGAAARKKTPAKAAPQVTEEAARASFETFAQDWMNKLVEAEEFQRTKQVKVTETPDGFFAEYVGYLPQRTIEVKKTAYTDTPFVGTLMYNERMMRSSGKSKEDALQGPFEQIKAYPVREIFRFTKGKWVY